MASATPRSALFKAIAPFATLLRSAPHRDATHIPYAQWLSLYVESLGKASQKSAGSSIPYTAASSVVGRTERELFLRQVHAIVDAMLLSSLVASRWNQVLVPANQDELQDLTSRRGDNREETGKAKGNTQPEGNRMGLWFLNTCGHGVAPPPVGNRCYNVVGGEGDTLEVFTPKFMTEPLLGGACLTHWTAELRQQSASLRSLREDDSNLESRRNPTGTVDKTVPLGGNRTVHLTIPFSCLWQIKHEAHLRSGVSATTISLQERCVRQSLLQNIHHVLQLQADFDRIAQPVSAPAPSIKLHISRPTEEFDMICQLPRIRDAFLTLGSADPKSKAEVDSAMRRNLSLGALCEQNAVRLAYFVRYSLYWAHIRSGFTQKADLGKEKVEARGVSQGPLPMVMIAHPSEHRLFRSLGVPALRHVSASTTLRQSALGGFNSSSTHKKVMHECGQVVRRMTTREENLRQSIMKT